MIAKNPKIVNEYSPRGRVGVVPARRQRPFHPLTPTPHGTAGAHDYYHTQKSSHIIFYQANALQISQASVPAAARVVVLLFVVLLLLWRNWIMRVGCSRSKRERSPWYRMTSRERNSKIERIFWRKSPPPFFIFVGRN